ncbi:PAS domain S-box protein [Duganella sp. S19_KUP01_CR8]|uniref:PAS domain S-box protein n=1 Tax=Duganella sp. S19_KUP01_CR8 TaxID=3025502 RepID=UPI002FCD8A65
MQSLIARRLAPRNVLRMLAGGLAALVTVVVTLYALGRYEGQQTLAELEMRIRGRSIANAGILQRELDDLRRDTIFLASVPPVAGLARAEGNGGYDALENTPGTYWEARLVNIFTAYAIANPDITQLRLIGVADQGRERIRIDRSGGKLVATSKADLQQKGETEYMRMAMRLPAGQTYLSEINLNREHGELQVPHVATIRAATPVYNSAGQVFAVVVINYDVRAIMRPVSGNLPTGFRAYLTNAAGDFVLHPDPSRAYGFERGRRWRWQDEFATTDGAGLSTSLQQVTAANGQSLYVAETRVKLDPAQPGRDYRFMLAATDTAVTGAMMTMRLGVLFAMLVGALLVGAAAQLYLRQRRQVDEHQARMSAIVENSHDAIIGKTLDGTVTSWNRGAERMFGYAAGEAIGRSLAELIVPADAADEEAQILRRIAQGDGVADMHTRRRRRDGRLLTVSVTSSPIRGADGRIIGAAKTVRDIGEQEAANQRVRDLNATLEQQVRQRTLHLESVTMLQRAILDHASYAIIATDETGIIRLFNPAAERMLGYAADQVLGLLTPAVLHDPDEVAARAAVLSQELQRVVEPGFEAFVAKARLGLADENEWTYIRRDGSRFPVLLSVTALSGADGVINGYLGIASDTTAREQDRRVLVAARDQLLDAAEVAELGIWTWTLDTGLLEWNQRMYDFYDVPPEAYGGGLHYEHWRQHVHPDDVDATVAKLMDAVAGTGKYDPVFRVVRADGTLRYIQAAASVERDAKGKAIRVLGINRDITAQHQAEATLRAATEAADSANRAKSEFLANMSHEIRSPMNAVLGMLALLKTTALDTRQLDYADKAERAGRALLGILNDILDFSRVEAGKLTLDPYPFSHDQLLREISVILAANLEDKDIEISYRIDPALPDWMVGDAMRLQQVLINLAGNAIKFTQQGEVVVTVQALPPEQRDIARYGADALRVGFGIRDTGIGISAEQCQRIFVGFSQAEASTARRYGGSGLGLSISQRLVAMMDGVLTVESVVGQGSTFSFSIACQRAPAPAASGPGAARFGALRCLVVDDHETARASMTAMLASFGWTVDAVPSGAAALAAIEHNAALPYDVYFVDWRMTGMDGWETAVRIRRLAARGQAPLIIMVTAHGREVLALQQADGEVLDGVVVKPATPSMLFDAVAKAADPARANGATRLAGARRLAGLRLLLVEDNPTNQQVAFELLNQEGASVEVANDGSAAIRAVLGAVQSFDCVLMDIQMPQMDGYTATRAIRAQPNGARLPIIAMTANVMESDRELALAAGMNDHVGKPFDLPKLVETICRHTGRDKPEPQPVAAAAQPAARLERPGLEGGTALARFGGNTLFYRRALRGFVAELATLEDQVPLLPGGSAASAAALHSLKGVAGTVGADALAEAASGLEQLVRDQASPAAWAAAHAALMSVARQAAESATALAADLESLEPAQPAAISADPSALPDGLRKLHGLLAASNLDALPLFEALLRDYGQRMPAEFSEMNDAIERFDFAAAAQHCAATQRQLPAEPS